MTLDKSKTAYQSTTNMSESLNNLKFADSTNDISSGNRDWEIIQKKTFTNWINSQLKQKKIAPIVDINTDLSSGERLIELLGILRVNSEIIGDESLGRYTKTPKLRLQKIENVNKALEFIKKRGVNLTNIGAEDIVDSNPKLLLGLIWTIILRFSIADISEEGMTAKEGLLLWCQRRTAPYAPEVRIKEFTFSWADGLALCALIHRHRPDLLDYHKLDKKNKHFNVNLAFEIAEEKLNIPKLFGVEDLCDVIKPDDRSVMTYVAQYFHAFSAQDKFGVAGRRVGNLGNILGAVWEMQNDYERRSRLFLEAVAERLQEWSNYKSVSLSDARRSLAEFESYKGTTKRAWVAERYDLDTLLGNIQTKLKTYNLRPYFAPEGLALVDLTTAWDGLVSAEASQKRSLTKYIREAKDAIRLLYAKAANSFNDELSALQLSLTRVEGELADQLTGTKSIQVAVQPLQSQIEELKTLDSKCVEANIDDNEFTIYSVEDLVFSLSLVSNSLSKKISFLENQIVARTKTNFSPQQLEEYSETFKFFDKDDNNFLTRGEFKAALAAFGSAFSNEVAFEKLFLQVSQGAESINFEKFIEYARSVEEDKTTPEQLLEAFATLASDKGHVTEAELYRGGLTPAMVEVLKTRFVAKGDGYDYAGFVSSVFV